MFFQADSDQVTACESPRGEYFLSVHRSTSPAWDLQTGYPSTIWNGSFLSLPWTACQDEFPCLEHHLPWNYHGKVWVSWPTPFATDIADEALKAYKRGPKRSLQPLTGPSTGRNWSTQSNTYRFSWPGLHQPVLVPAPSQPASSYQSQVTLSHHAPWLQGYISTMGCTSNPTLFLSAVPYTFRFFQVFLQLFSSPDCHTPFFLPGYHFS